MASWQAWNDGEKDWELLKEIFNLFEMNSFRSEFDLDTLMSDICKTQSKIRASEEMSEEVRAELLQKMKNVEDRVKEIQSQCPEQRVPRLTVLSAIAVCKKYRDSEEIQKKVSCRPKSRLRQMEWSDACRGRCQELESTSSVRCGFCRSIAQIK